MQNEDFEDKRVPLEGAAADSDADMQPGTGAVIGGVGGAAVGALAGSLLGPLGTAIGAVVGGVAGAGTSAAVIAAEEDVDVDGTIADTDLGRGYVADDVLETDITTSAPAVEADQYAVRLDAEMEAREAAIAQHLTDEERARLQRMP